MRRLWRFIVAWLRKPPTCSLCGHSRAREVVRFKMAAGEFRLCIDETMCKARAAARNRAQA